MWPCPVRRRPCALRSRGRLSDLSTAAAMADMPNPAALQAVPPANVGAALRASHSVRRQSGCVSWMHRRMFQRQQETTAAVRIWAILPNQKSGEGQSAVLAAAIGSKGDNPAEVVAGPQKRTGPF